MLAEPLCTTWMLPPTDEPGDGNLRGVLGLNIVVDPDVRRWQCGIRLDLQLQP